MRENVFSKSVRNSHRVSKCPRHFVTSKIVHAPRACVLVGAWTLGGSVRCIDSYLSLASSRSESSLSPELLESSCNHSSISSQNIARFCGC